MTNSYVDPTVQAYQSQIASKASGLSAQGQAYLSQQTNGAVTAANVSNGVNAVSSLTSSYDPNNPADNAKLINAISAGLCYVPGVGPLLGAYVQGMWILGNKIGCPVEKFFNSIFGGALSPECGGQACTHTGTDTPSLVLQGSTLPPAAFWRPGTFAGLVIPALAMNAAQAGNCKPALLPGLVVDSCVNIWNQTHYGPAKDFYVPPLTQLAFYVPIIVTATTVSGQPVSNNEDLNAYFAFQRVDEIQKALAAAGRSGDGPPFGAPSNTILKPSSARYVKVNTGGSIPTLGQIATTGAVVAGVGVAAWWAYAAWKGVPMLKVFAR